MASDGRKELARVETEMHALKAELDNFLFLF